MNREAREAAAAEALEALEDDEQEAEAGPSSAVEDGQHPSSLDPPPDDPDFPSLPGAIPAPPIPQRLSYALVAATSRPSSTSVGIESREGRRVRTIPSTRAPQPQWIAPSRRFDDSASTSRWDQLRNRPLKLKDIATIKRQKK